MKRGRLLTGSGWVKVGMLAAFAAVADAGRAAPSPALIADRLAVENVYAVHRAASDPASRAAVPPAVAERLVCTDLKKEAVLARIYRITLTPSMVQAEVERIDATTRTAAVLAEIKAALGNDQARFAETVAKPLVVERVLRERFDGDDALHAPERRRAEAARARLLDGSDGGFAAGLAALKAGGDGDLQQSMQWELGAHPASPMRTAPLSIPSRAAAASGAYRNEATVQVAQVYSPTEAEPAPDEPKFYFDELPTDLQRVLLAQLRQSGDVSALIETAGAFQVYLARERTEQRLAVAIFTVHKRSYEDWLAEQPDA